MKLMDQMQFERLLPDLSVISRRYKLEVRLESYSCKMIKEEKRRFKKFLEKHHPITMHPLGPSITIHEMHHITTDPLPPSSYRMSDEVVLDTTSQPSPTRQPSSVKGKQPGSKRSRSNSFSGARRRGSPDRPDVYQISSKDLFCLMETMNLTFEQEYEFVNADSTEFSLEPEIRMIQRYVASKSVMLLDRYYRVEQRLWRIIDDEINFSQCHIYSYRPDGKTDPYSQNCLDSFNYFFFNKIIKRIVFLSLCVLDIPAGQGEEEEEECEQDNDSINDMWR